MIRRLRVPKVNEREQRYQRQCKEDVDLIISIMHPAMEYETVDIQWRVGLSRDRTMKILRFARDRGKVVSRTHRGRVHLWRLATAPPTAGGGA